ncbi:hypothetical protein [Dyadobacter sp. 50-39]|uniref:hypothetical protein n=1 Tax=Dyadobacter sp. 50-39 TaxID=1895756 RepID=UPI0025BCFF04|nr:hypothetical protein [Dyadobacter sp. 50-39]
MKRVIPIWAPILLLLIVAAGGYLFYKTPTNPGPATLELPEHPTPPGHQPAMFEGTVQAYGNNPEGDMDKILLRSEKGEIWLHFPPHTARQVIEAAPLHATVSVQTDRRGPTGPGADHRCELKALKNNSSNTEIILSDISPPAPSAGTEAEVRGNAAHDLEIGTSPGNTFMLSKKQISLPPHMAEELLPLIRRAGNIVVKGKMRDSTQGFVSASGHPVIQATLVQLDSISYKIR